MRCNHRCQRVEILSQTGVYAVVRYFVIESLTDCHECAYVYIDLLVA